MTDRETKTHRRARSNRSYGHCRRRTEIPEAKPSFGVSRHCEERGQGPSHEPRPVTGPGDGRHTGRSPRRGVLELTREQVFRTTRARALAIRQQRGGRDRSWDPFRASIGAKAIAAPRLGDAAPGRMQSRDSKRQPDRTHGVGARSAPARALSWEATPNNRRAGRGWPECAKRRIGAAAAVRNRRVPVERSLAVLRPDLLGKWYPSATRALIRMRLDRAQACGCGGAANTALTNGKPAQVAVWGVRRALIAAAL